MRKWLIVLAVAVVVLAAGCKVRERFEARVAQVQALHAARVARCASGEIGQAACDRADEYYGYLEAAYRIIQRGEATRVEIKAALRDLEAMKDAELAALAAD